jgi:hypothetical protein
MDDLRKVRVFALPVSAAAALMLVLSGCASEVEAPPSPSVSAPYQPSPSSAPELTVTEPEMLPSEEVVVEQGAALQPSESATSQPSVSVDPTDTLDSILARATDAAAFVAGQGWSLEQAEQYLAGEGLNYRVMSVDGEPLPATKDYSFSRVNLTTVNGIVTDAFVG